MQTTRNHLFVHISFSFLFHFLSVCGIFSPTKKRRPPLYTSSPGSTASRYTGLSPAISFPLSCQKHHFLISILLRTLQSMRPVLPLSVHLSSHAAMLPAQQALHHQNDHTKHRCRQQTKQSKAVNR